jgi:hypothetical protein
LTPCPSPRKPRKNAPAPQWEQYRDERQASRISTRGAERIAALRQAMDGDGQHDRPLIVAVDGSYTNHTVVNRLPERTVLIGRIRKDAKLYLPPEPDLAPVRGRKRCYGAPLPTPDQLRQDATVPWQKVTAFAAGRAFEFEIKSFGPLRWRGTGQRDLRLVIVRPLAYRPRKGAHLLYREPAYLLCTDPWLDLAQLLQAYLWRWEIEVNFRDQKTLLGTGQAQVRTPGAAARVPVLIATAYAFLHLSLQQAQGKPILPLPRWRRSPGQARCSSAQGINLLRAALWGRAVGVEDFTDFAKIRRELAKSEKGLHDPASAMFYAAT